MRDMYQASSVDAAGLMSQSNLLTDWQKRVSIEGQRWKGTTIFQT